MSPLALWRFGARNNRGCWGCAGWRGEWRKAETKGSAWLLRRFVLVYKTTTSCSEIILYIAPLNFVDSGTVTHTNCCPFNHRNSWCPPVGPFWMWQRVRPITSKASFKRSLLIPNIFSGRAQFIPPVSEAIYKKNKKNKNKESSPRDKGTRAPSVAFPECETKCASNLQWTRSHEAVMISEAVCHRRPRRLMEESQSAGCALPFPLF